LSHAESPRHRSRRPPDPREEPFIPKLKAEPFMWPESAPVDPLAARRARAEHLCLWLACDRALCRRARRCVGPNAECVRLQRDVKRPLLEEVAGPGEGPR
jgi:hypothetical protein